jgi:hypothetical protein
MIAALAPLFLFVSFVGIGTWRTHASLQPKAVAARENEQLKNMPGFITHPIPVSASAPEVVGR